MAQPDSKSLTELTRYMEVYLSNRCHTHTPKYPYNTITASDMSKYLEYGQYGFTCVQAHLPLEKQNVYPLVEHVLSNGTGASFRFWDARTGQELRDRFPVSVLSIQHH